MSLTKVHRSVLESMPHGDKRFKQPSGFVNSLLLPFNLVTCWLWTLPLGMSAIPTFSRGPCTGKAILMLDMHTLRKPSRIEAYICWYT